MNLFLTTSGRSMLALGLLYCLVGAIAGSPLLILIGQIPIVLLVVALFLYLPGAMVLDRRLIQLCLRPVDHVESSLSATSTHVVGDIIPLQLEITNKTHVTLYGLRATAFTSAHLTTENLDTDPQAVLVRPKSVTRMPVNFRADRAGRRSVQGFDVNIRDPLGLIECMDYLPANHVFECYPAVGRMRRPQMTVAALNQDAHHAGRPIRHRAPGGTDVRELRDYNPGEPLKNIAWKASARARKLIARDFAGESESSFYVILDISGTMRAQQRQSLPNKLDRTIEYVAELAQFHTQNRQPLGLITFDERVYAHIPPANGSAHLRRILNHLTTLNCIAQPERTEFDEVELQRFLADYLLVQERLDFRIRKDGKKSVNAELLERWLKGTMHAERGKFDSPALTDALIEPNELTLARRFLQLRGVGIPLRAETRHGLKERSLADAMELINRTPKQKQHVTIVTDLIGIVNIDLLTRTIKVARAKGSQIEILVPIILGNDVPTNAGGLTREGIIHELFTATDIEERNRILQHLHSVAVTTRTLS